MTSHTVSSFDTEGKSYSNLFNLLAIELFVIKPFIIIFIDINIFFINYIYIMLNFRTILMEWLKK